MHCCGVLLLGLTIGASGCSILLGASSENDDDTDPDAGVADGAPGGFAPWQLDLAGVAPGGPIVLAGQVLIDTTTREVTIDGSPSGLTVDLAMARSGMSVVVIAATSIEVTAGARVRAEGDRALVLFAETIDVSGHLDVSSRRGQSAGAGAATREPACATEDTTGRSGGSGGGHNGAGGDGGTGLPVGGAMVELDELGAGCAGGRNVLATGEARAASGGALQLVASVELLLGEDTVLEAGGAGGHAGGGVCCTSSGGGGGGGAGGMIVLDAHQLVIADGASLWANGGAGGGGLDVDDVAMAGGDGLPGTASAAGGPSGCFGGRGGGGGALAAPPTTGGAGQGTSGHGGGGGAAGRIVIVGHDGTSGTFSPAPTQVVR